MVNNSLKYLFLLLVSFLFSAQATAVCVDTVFVFKKMPADTVIVKSEAKKTAVKKKKSVAKKKKPAEKKSEPKNSVAQKVVKKKVDSVKMVPVRYSLGDRVIMRGDSGADIKKLAEIMVKNLYMDEAAVPYTKSGQVLYEGELVRAVKLFQKVSGLYDDGIVGTTTIKALRKIHRWRRTSK